MEALFDEEMVRNEMRILDIKTGLHAADLPIEFGNAKNVLGRFVHSADGMMKFYFSNYYLQNPNHPVENKLDIIRHEYAHYMDYMLNGSTSHGPLWKECCTIVGAFPIRYYNETRSEYLLEKHKKERELNGKCDGYTIGEIVEHPKYGKGQIIDITGEKTNRVANIEFGDLGIKKIAVRWIACNCQK